MSEGHAFIVRCRPCGGIYFAAVEDPSMVKERRQGASYAARYGDDFLRVTCEEVRQAKWCSCDPNPRTGKPRRRATTARTEAFA